MPGVGWTEMRWRSGPARLAARQLAAAILRAEQA
jgi:hypothetical protein